MCVYGTCLLKGEEGMCLSAGVGGGWEGGRVGGLTRERVRSSRLCTDHL